MSVRIVHLSDLHFGMKGQTDVWESLSTYLRNELKPQLILVTGDIVDTPSPDLYRVAAEKLAQLQINGTQCFVCAGNHDRHEQGNAISGLSRRFQGPAGWIRSFFQKLAPHDNKNPFGVSNSSHTNALFDQAFANQGMLLQLLNPQSFISTSGRNKWRVRLVGLDSSSDARFFAQGHISPQVMQKLRTVLSKSPSDHDQLDLVITLVHHHLLPVMRSENSGHDLESVLSGTTVLNNAGSLLEALAHGEVDLVLHGHEHARHAARYSSLESKRGDVIVIGAGSATGAHTKQGCNITRASFNLLELTDDSSVVLREVRNEGPGWEILREEKQLMSAREIRRGRYFRRSPEALMPQSKWVRHFEFTASRDCLIRESLSNWVIDEPCWVTSTKNSSGEPYFVHGEIELTQGRIIPLMHDKPFTFKGAGQYELCQQLPIDYNSKIVARRVDQEILWVGGAILTQDDLKRCDGGPYRSEKYEFIAAHVKQGIESLTLTLELPRKFRPANNTFEVIAETPDGHQHRLKELQDRLSVTGRSKVRATLTIPYPQPGVRYVLSWPLPTLAPIAPELESSRKSLAALAGNVVAQMGEALQTIFPDKTYSIALYIPEIFNESLSFRMLSSNGSEPQPPKRVTPTANQNSFCIAHWGVPNCFSAKVPLNPDQDEKAGGLVDGETAIFSIPVVNLLNAGLLSADEESLAILRVGWLSETSRPTDLSKMVACCKVATRGLLPLLKES
ncbi:metallophosphoesterase family protein [Pseudomonas soli]|uniref:metallophosphoesterase family protein n=1 Tax=Pseudomonas soli TaxID=1306993 RepID=UPI003DA9D0F5